MEAKYIFGIIETDKEEFLGCCGFAADKKFIQFLIRIFLQW